MRAGHDMGVAVRLPADQRLVVAPAVGASARGKVATAAVVKARAASSRIFREAVALAPARIHTSAVVGAGHYERGVHGEQHVGCGATAGPGHV